MADEADIANDVMMADLDRRIEAARGIPKKKSLEECAECGDEIPIKRQEAIEGVEHCFACASRNEQKRNSFI